MKRAIQSSGNKGRRGIARFASTLVRCGFVREEEGRALIETVLAMTFILFPTLFGCFTVCYAQYMANFMSSAAREGARWAAVRGSQCSTNTPSQTHCGATATDIQNYLQSSGYPGANGLTVTATWLTATSTTTNNVTTTSWSACGTTSACKKPGNIVQVTTSYTFNFPFTRWARSNLTSYGSTASMIVAQ